MRAQKRKKVRYRSLDNVFEEISVLIKNKSNLRTIQFYDDTFTLNLERVMEFCRRFQPIYKEFGINWVCEIHCQTVYDKPDMIRKMVESGLIEAQIGLESVENSILTKINKKSTREMIFKTIEHCKNAGLYILEGNLLLAATDETKTQIESYYDAIEQLLLAGKGMLQLYVVMFWPFPNTPISNNPSKYGIRILPDQCEYSLNSIKNFVSESENISREEYIEYFSALNDRIESIYKKICSTMNRDEAAKHWRNGSFSSISSWGKSLSTFNHMNTYFKAHDGKNTVSASTKGAYLIRTFDMLVYNGKSLYIKEADITVSELDSRILELSNGANTIDDIAKVLMVEPHKICERVNDLENRMLLYGSII